MSSRKVSIQIVSPDILEDNCIVIGRTLTKAWKLKKKQLIQLSFGSFKQSVTVIPQAKYTGIGLNKTLAQKMGILMPVSLRIDYKSQSSTLVLGPLIGILISRDYPETTGRPFGSITMFCNELVNACQKEGGYVYFFTPNHITSEPDQVQAWVYGNGWKQTTVPAANVFYNRLTSRKLENKPSVQHFMKEVKSRYKSHFFNEKFLDKTEVFDALGRDITISHYLPESHLFRNFSMLKKMCARHPIVFLKPVTGSLGKGIIRIVKLDNGAYLTMTTNIGGIRKHNHDSLLKLFASLSGKMKTTRYQIQQGLHLMELERRPVDFRALVQKNVFGKWNVTSVVARTAGSQHFVSNLARGGSLSSVKDAIARSNLTIDMKKKVSLRLKQASLDIAQAIDTQIPYHFGELGIDLAVDTAGKIWLLEVNSKPSKNDNTPLGDSKIRPSVKQVVQYSRYLTNL